MFCCRIRMLDVAAVFVRCLFDQGSGGGGGLLGVGGAVWGF